MIIFRTFPNTGTEYSGYHAAQDWLAENGFYLGPLDRQHESAPMGVHRVSGSTGIYMWRHLTPQERRALDGQLGSMMGSPRNDGMVLCLKEEVIEELGPGDPEP
jgi:hypothetical protein